MVEGHFWRKIFYMSKENTRRPASPIAAHLPARNVNKEERTQTGARLIAAGWKVLAMSGGLLGGLAGLPDVWRKLVQLFLRSQVGGMRSQWVFEIAKNPLDAKRRNCSSPVPGGLMKSNAHESRPVVGVDFSVLSVFRRGGFTEIANPVVVADAVDVIRVSVRPSAIDIEPRKPVSLILAAPDKYPSVSLCHVNAAGKLACFSPEEIACIGVVYKLGAQLVGCKVLHLSPRLCFDQLWPMAGPVLAQLLARDLVAGLALNADRQIGRARLHAIHDVLHVPLGGPAPLGEFVALLWRHGGQVRFKVHVGIKPYGLPTCNNYLVLFRWCTYANE